MDYTTFTLPSGAIVSVETSHAPEPTQSGVGEASAATDKIAVAWSDGMKMVSEVVDQAIQQLRQVTAFAKEVSVELGINISSKGGIVLVEGTAAANLKIALKW
jgi:hypothetical protein